MKPSRKSCQTGSDYCYPSIYINLNLVHMNVKLCILFQPLDVHGILHYHSVHKRGPWVQQNCVVLLVCTVSVLTKCLIIYALNLEASPQFVQNLEPRLKLGCEQFLVQRFSSLVSAIFYQSFIDQYKLQDI
jgi:hypothetical protein